MKKKMKLIIEVDKKYYEACKDAVEETYPSQIEEVVANGTPYNPTGDCISREDLKEDFKSRLALCNEWIEKAKDKETKIRASAVKSYIAEVIMTIDNAPTVDIKDELAGAYNEGYMCGSREAEKARPQGEWIKIGNIGLAYTCNKCGEVNVIPTNFCPNCGLPMKKGGAEND